MSRLGAAAAAAAIFIGGLGTGLASHTVTAEMPHVATLQEATESAKVGPVTLAPAPFSVRIGGLQAGSRKQAGGACLGVLPTSTKAVRAKR